MGSMSEVETAEENTIDFLVSIDKASDGTPIITPVYQEGDNLQSAQGVERSVSLTLQVGYDKRRHGHIDPCYQLRQGKPRDQQTGKYVPVRFFPSNPPDRKAGQTKMLIKPYEGGSILLQAEDGDSFTDNTIVEFRYDFQRRDGWRWVPIKVRHDKTADLRQGGSNFGNAYHVANSNWHGIHNPISRSVIASGDVGNNSIANNDLYYNSRGGPTRTRPMRDFHNLFVKATLIRSALPRRGSLIDLAVGKGGDIQKWISAGAKFVLGLDLARDNITNPLDGACARMLNYQARFKDTPDVVFDVANSALLYSDGSAFASPTGFSVYKALRGEPSR